MSLVSTSLCRPPATCRCAFLAARRRFTVSAAVNEEEEIMGLHDTHEAGVIGRKQLVTPTLWEQYSEKVRSRMENPKYRGTISKEEAEARGCDLVVVDHGAEACGDAVRLHLAVQKGTGIVLDARFQTFGCATAIAASDATAELCIGKTVDEAQKAVTSAAVEKFLRDDPDKPSVPPQKMHCSVMASEVVKKAAESLPGHEAKMVPEEDEVVCDCAQVTLGAIRRAMREHGLKTVAEVTQHTKAGAFCGACRKPGGHESKPRYLYDIVRAERARARVVKAIQDKITPTLGAHSGGCEVLSVTYVDETPAEAAQPNGADGAAAKGAPKKETMVVKLSFQGACSGCAHSAGATLAFIEDALRTELNDPSIVVVGN